MMVMKPLSPCNKIGCKNITGESYCEEHQHIVEERNKERNRHYNKHKRNQELQRFYDSKLWRMTREERIRIDNGLCQDCLKENKITYAGEVDHIVPIKIDWNKRLIISNLQSLCSSCHSIKSIEDRRKCGDGG